MNKMLFVFACLVSISCHIVHANEEQTDTEKTIPEYIKYIPKEILVLCYQRPIRGCTDLLNQFFCAYKLTEGNLTEGEQHLCNEISKEAKIFDSQDNYIATLVKLIVEANSNATPDQIADIINRALASKRLMQHHIKNGKNN